MVHPEQYDGQPYKMIIHSRLCTLIKACNNTHYMGNIVNKRKEKTQEDVLQYSLLSIYLDASLIFKEVLLCECYSRFKIINRIANASVS